MKLNIFSNKILLLVFAILFLINCSTPKYVPTDNHSTYIYKDSIIIRVDTIKIPIPIEVIKEVVPQLDTLEMETSVSKSVSYLDTATCTLKGILENKPVELKKEIIYQDRIIQRDTIIYKEIPVEVQVEKKVVPSWCWYLLGFNILLLIILAIKIYLKLK